MPCGWWVVSCFSWWHGEFPDDGSGFSSRKDYFLDQSAGCREKMIASRVWLPFWK